MTVLGILGGTLKIIPQDQLKIPYRAERVKA